MEITIKKAGIADLPILMEWRMRVLREVFSDHESVDWETLERGNAAYYGRHLADDTHTACFALEESGAVVGCGGICYQSEMPSPDNPGGSCGYLMNIFTVPELRGNGIGRKIVDFLIRDARERKTGKIYLESSQTARQLYKNMGFQPMADYYKL